VCSQDPAGRSAPPVLLLSADYKLLCCFVRDIIGYQFGYYICREIKSPVFI
jgi:hypothetical protein